MSKIEINQVSNIEPLKSPFSRVYLCPQTNKTINCAIGLKHPIDVRNPNGQDQWKRTQVNIDDHFIVHYPTPGRLEVEDEEALVNGYLAEFAMSSFLTQNKPLGDGFSLMSMLSSCFGHKREVIDGLNCDVNGKKNNNHAKRKLWKCRIWVLIMSLWLTIVYGLRLLWRFLWLKDEISMLSGGDGVELWPRTIVTVKFKIEDLQSIKMAIPNVTVNDVLLRIISSGLSKYINVKTKEDLKQSIQVTAAVPVNLRKKHCSQQSQVASWCCHRVLCNTTLLVSNTVGPSEEIAIANNPVSYIRVNVSSLPHAMTMHMVSYAGKANLQLMVAKDIITNPQLLAKCIEDSFIEMKSSIQRESIV